MTASDVLRTQPHRRLNPLTGEWVLVSPQRIERPWLGRVDRPSTTAVPAYDPACYLCPGNPRAGGQHNPAYASKWMIHSDCKVMISKLWVRFVPHFCSGDKSLGRVLGIPDEGMNLPLGNAVIKAVPAHFMHSEGNFQFYDPISKILFSGDMGASIVGHTEADTPVEDFQAHIKYMEGFPKRYMISNKICRFWVNMVRQMDVEAIVPQHGRAFVGKKMVNEFVNWIEALPCGVDIMTQENYRVPA